MGLNPKTMRPPPSDEGKLRCTQLLEYKEEDWVRDIAAFKLNVPNTRKVKHEKEHGPYDFYKP